MIKRKFVLGYQSLKRIVALFLGVVAATSLSGCITFLTEINVKGDGSGMMVQTITMNPEQIKEMMESIAKQMGASTTESKEEPKKDSQQESGKGPFRENDLRDRAADLGTGVTFVSAEKIDTKTAAGVRVTYAFKDINNLAVNPKPAAAMGKEGAGVSAQDSLKFRFSRKPNGNAVLAIVLPQSKHEETKEPAAPLPPPSPEASAQNTAMIMQMFKGLHMGIAVNVGGRVVKTNSPYVEGSKVTLMDIDFDPLLSDEKGVKALSEKIEKAEGDDRKTMEALKGMKGLKITTDPEIVIEFAPQL